MSAVIEVRGLEFRYPDGTEALRGIDFRLEAGETAALLGANGSGKTTFALHLVGLLEGHGEISICGLRLSKHTVAEIRRRAGFVFQDSDDQLFMPSVIEDVAFGLLSRGVAPADARRQAAAALERVDMAHAASKAPYHLSAGQKRRAAIAGVLVMEPEILILDEPTTYLDPPGQEDLAALLGGLPQAKLIITHDLRFAARLASRAVFFRHGRIEGEGPVNELASRFGWSGNSGPARD